MVRVWSQKTLFLSEHAAVYFLIGQNPVCKYKKKQLRTSLPSTSLTTTSQLRHSVLYINPQPTSRN